VRHGERWVDAGSASPEAIGIQVPFADQRSGESDIAYSAAHCPDLEAAVLA
jgi:hypothetical protein